MGTVERRSGPTVADRAAAAFLLVLMTVGCLGLWIGVPAGWLWLAGQITSDQAQHILISLIGAPFAMIAWARFLFWLNRLHARVTTAHPRLDADDEEEDDDDEARRFLSGPLEPLLVGTLWIALVALVFWFFALAKDPPGLLFG